MSANKAETFEDLWIWQQARILVQLTYEDFGKGSQAAGDYAFEGQIHRASLSVMNNIAEGFERNSDAEFAQYLKVSKGSCGEVRSMYYVAEDLGYVPADVAQVGRGFCRQLSAGIASLRSHVRTR